MTQHVRGAVRSALVNAVAAITPAPFTTVTDERPHALAANKLPALIVTYRRGAAGARALRGAHHQRDLEFSLEIKARGANLQTGLDTLALAVERAVTADTTLGGKVLDLRFQSDSLDISGEGEQRTGTLTLIYEVLVATPEADPAV